MTDKPLVSVIVPAYNVEQYVKKCIESICNQTYENLEIIVIDDGSTDSTYDILNEIAQKDHRLILLQQKNQGPSAARNKALAIAKGQWFMFVDSDDWIDQDMVEKMFITCQEKSCQMAVSALVRVRDDKETLEANFQDQIIDSQKALEYIAADLVIKNQAWCKLFKKETLEGFDFPEGELFEDIYFTYRCIERCDKIALLGQPMYHYRIHSQALTQQGTNDNNRMRCLSNMVRYKDLSTRNQAILPVLQQQYFYAYRKYIMDAKTAVRDQQDIDVFFNELSPLLLENTLLNKYEKEEVKLILNNDKGMLNKLQLTELKRKAKKAIGRVVK